MDRKPILAFRMMHQRGDHQEPSPRSGNDGSRPLKIPGILPRHQEVTYASQKTYDQDQVVNRIERQESRELSGQELSFHSTCQSETGTCSTIKAVADLDR